MEEDLSLSDRIKSMGPIASTEKTITARQVKSLVKTKLRL